MTGKQGETGRIDVKALLEGEEDYLSAMVAAIVEVLSQAAWQRCYVHFLRNALDHLPRRVGDDCLHEPRWFYDRRDLNMALLLEHKKEAMPKIEQSEAA